MAFDTDNNVTLINGSTSADIRTTYLTTTGKEGHYQNVMIVDQTGNVEFGTDPFPMYLTNSAGTPVTVTDGNISVQLAGASTVNSIIVGQSLDTVIVAGKAGATAIAITADNFRIRGLSAATDSISVYGVVGATAIAITAENLQIRGLTAATDSVSVQGVSGGKAVNILVHGSSGATAVAIGVSSDALKVFMTNPISIDGNIEINAAELDIRYLSYGTFNDAAPAGTSFDSVRVAGFSGAYPVATALFGISGNSWSPVGVSGGKLVVDIGALTLTGGTFNIDMSNVSVTNTVRVQGSTGATAPVWISGSTEAGGAITVTGGGTGGSIRIEGFTWGTAVGITAANLQIRGLTYGSTNKDWVGISGDVAEDLDAIKTLMGTLTDQGRADSIYGALYESADSLLNIKNTVGANDVTIADILNHVAVNPNLATAKIRVEIGAIADSLDTNNTLPVEVVSMTQPGSVYNGVVTVTNNPITLPNQVVKSGVTVKAFSTNTAVVFVGNGSVTVNNGYELSAGESVFLEVDNLNLVSVIAVAANNQKICYIAS